MTHAEVACEKKIVNHYHRPQKLEFVVQQVTHDVTVTKDQDIIKTMLANIKETSFVCTASPLKRLIHQILYILLVVSIILTICYQRFLPKQQLKGRNWLSFFLPATVPLALIPLRVDSALRNRTRIPVDCRRIRLVALPVSFVAWTALTVEWSVAYADTSTLEVDGFAPGIEYAQRVGCVYGDPACEALLWYLIMVAMMSVCFFVEWVLCLWCDYGLGYPLLLQGFQHQERPIGSGEETNAEDEIPLSVPKATRNDNARKSQMNVARGDSATHVEIVLSIPLQINHNSIYPRMEGELGQAIVSYENTPPPAVHFLGSKESLSSGVLRIEPSSIRNSCPDRKTIADTADTYKPVSTPTMEPQAVLKPRRRDTGEHTRALYRQQPRLDRHSSAEPMIQVKQEDHIEKRYSQFPPIQDDPPKKEDDPPKRCKGNSVAFQESSQGFQDTFSKKREAKDVQAQMASEEAQRKALFDRMLSLT
ncbi:hypothetical protein BGZ58_005676 [Dissophora ornata]|nr:hypothetical protein BGZ58_005676 [Dissophora ornata]